jgi:MerR family copper efflux transcriptional regulator
MGPCQGPNECLVGTLAKASGTTVKALRVYETHQLIAPLRRTQTGYRVYDTSLVSEIRLIALMQSIGISLSEIRACTAPDAPMLIGELTAGVAHERLTAAIELYERHLRGIDNQMATLRDRRAAISQRLIACRETLDLAGTSTGVKPAIGVRRSVAGRVEYELTRSAEPQHSPEERSR